MAAVVAQAHYTFGLRTGVANNLFYFDEQTVIFPCGNNVVRFNIDNRWQKFIPGSERSQGMAAMTMSPNKRYLAVAERTEKGTITVYDLHHAQCRRRKVLTGGEVPVQEFACLAFSPDSKFLIAQSGAPDWILFYWMWEKQKVLATVKTCTLPSTIFQVSFSPHDNTLICASGNGVFKLYRYTEGTLKQSYFQKQESLNFPCHVWMSDKRVIAGTDTGRLLVFESGDMRWEMDLASNSTREVDRQKTASSDSSSPRASLLRVTAITAFSKGFACSAGPGTVYLFEKTEEKDNYRKIRVIQIPDLQSAESSHVPSQDITALCTSPTEESLTACTDSGQLYNITLASAEISKGEQAHFEFLTHSFHSKAITGLSICIRKPLIATCSLDHSVRIWNYETNVLELYREFQEEAHSVALHPSGLFLLVGFTDKLRLMNLLIDDIRTFKELTVRGCRECAFSHGGHMFAAVNGNVIHIYSTTTFDNMLNLKGHNGKVQAVAWSPDDSRLVSCGMDGAVYEWNALSSKRQSESVLKSCSYTSVTLSPDGKSIFAVGSDQTLKEIQDCQVLMEMSAENVVFTAIVVTRSGRALFAGTSIGTIRVIKCPIPVQRDWTEYQAHSCSITKMVVTFDDQYLLSVSEDGCLFIWNIIDKEGRALKRDKDLTYSEEILITKSDLEEKNLIMAELKTRVEEMKTENEYQLGLKDISYNDKIKDCSEKYMHQIEGLKSEILVLKTEKERQVVTHQELLAEAAKKHSKELQDSELTHNRKLMLEYEKNHEMQLKLQRIQEDYEQQLQNAKKTKHETLEELTFSYEAKLQEKQRLLAKCLEDSQQRMRESEEMQKLIEEDCDQEIQGIRISAEKQLLEERGTNQSLKGETGIMKKKINSLLRDMEGRDLEMEHQKSELQKFQGVIRSLEKDLNTLKKEIQGRDETIQDKERRISELKKKNQELEKFKFVLDYQCQELKKEIEPRENEIKGMKEQLQEMEVELDKSHKKNTAVVVSNNELKVKLRTTMKNLQEESRRVKDLESLIQKFKTDLHQSISFIQEPKHLKKSIVELHKRYVQQDSLEDMVMVDADLKEEYSCQREHLERNAATFKRKVAKDSEVHRTENIKIMRENVMLIQQINELRTELRIVRSQLHDYECQHAVNKKDKTKGSHNLGAKSSSDVMPNTEVPRLNVNEESERIIQMQRAEIQRLRQEIQDQGQTLALCQRTSNTPVPHQPLSDP